ncbi:MAG: transglutaminaseTgpA domain-containing protein [Planctomycetota bacterium]
MNAVPGKIRRLLFLGDWLALAAATLFTAAPLRSEGGARAALLLAIWCAIPHLVGDRMRRRRRAFLGWRRGLTVFLVGAGALGLAYAGWELLREPSHEGAPIFAGTATLVVLTWVSGFLLFVPPFYRVYDFLGGGVLLLGLLERRPDAVLWVPLFLLGIAISSPRRHQLFDIIPTQVGSASRLASVSRSSLAFVLLASVLFGGFSALLFPILDADRLADEARPRRPLGAPDDAQRRREERRTADETATAREIGFPEVMRLADITEARGNETVVFRVRPEPTPGADPTVPPRLTNRLWRIVAFESFDAQTVEWTSFEREFEKRRWRRLGISRPNERLRHPGQGRYEFSIETLVFRNLVLPYSWSRVEPPEPESEDAHYFADGRGGIVPRDPALGVGTRYAVTFDPEADVAGSLPPVSRHGWRVDGEDLALPSDSELGFPLRELSVEIFGAARGTAAKVERLREFFAREMRYDLRLDWLPDDRSRRLGVFLGEARRGDCMYFATSAALLLRSARIPARFVAGYAGADWDPRDGSFAVRQSHAHAWIEIQVGPDTWTPLDPVTWTPGGLSRGRLASIDEAELPSTTTPFRIFPDGLLLAAALIAGGWAMLRRRDEDDPASVASEHSPSRPLRARTIRRQRPDDPLGAVLWEYDRLQTRLRRKRRHRRPSETPAEHRRRLAAATPEAAGALHELEDLIDRLVYGGRPAGPEDLAPCRGAIRPPPPLLNKWGQTPFIQKAADSE